MGNDNTISKIVDILNDYYKEENVDLQPNEHGYTIYIRFPKVTVTNEHNESIDITELYAKLGIDSYGLLIGTFLLNRAEYTATQWINRYKHSHVPPLEYNFISVFSSPCLGSGPIRDTTFSLNNKFDEDIWKLFAFELDKYVHTESLSGGTYIRLKEAKVLRPISNEINLDIAYIANNTSIISEFESFVLKHNPFRFCFNNNKYSIAADIYTQIVTLSNMFITWFNNLDSISQKNYNLADLLIKGRLEGHIFKFPESSYYDYSFNDYIGTPLWTFKGKTLQLNIINDIINSDEQLYPVTLLQPHLCIGILYKLEKLINYHNGTREFNDPIEENVIFL